MAWLPLVSAVLAAICLALPGAGLYAAMGLGIFATGSGLAAFRRDRAPRARLAGAGAVTLGGLALLLAGVRYGLALAALAALTRLAG